MEVGDGVFEGGPEQPSVEYKVPTPATPREILAISLRARHQPSVDEEGGGGRGTRPRSPTRRREEIVRVSPRLRGKPLPATPRVLPSPFLCVSLVTNDGA